ncbi:MAG: hypothetical protein FJ267_13910, partial [Planctomycetes bacterium]|nr:hypothetical protein [Planctomycetota bacterium]
MNLSNVFSLARALNAAHRVICAILRWIGLVVGIIPKAGRFSPGIYRWIHYAIIAVITLLLGWYSRQIMASLHASVPFSNFFIQRYYVAILFLLMFLVVRFFIAAYQIFMSKDLSEFEDIDVAWETGMEALAREGLDLQWLPVFLVNGFTLDQQKCLFEGSKLPWKVMLAGDDVRSGTGPLSFYACDEALFIGLTDVGAMSRQQKKTVSMRGGGGGKNLGTGAGMDSSIQSTMRPGQIHATVEQTRRPDQIQSAVGATLSPQALASAKSNEPRPAPVASGNYSETIRPGEIAGVSPTAPKAVATAAGRPGVLEKLSQDELHQNRRRLEYLCQRLENERGTYCPVNGLLQGIPIRWTQSTAHEPLMASIAHDIQTMHDALHLQFPVVCVHTGLDELTG